MERRFFISADAVSSEAEARIGGEEGRHLARVLRLRSGDRVELLDGKGRSYLARLLRVGPDSAVARIESELPFRRGESSIPVDLIQAVPKGNLLDGIIRRATELGVAAIQPVAARRSPPQGAIPGRLTRWRRIALEAVKQCGRSVVPEVREPLEAEACLRRPPAGEGWLLHPGGEPLGLHLACAGGSPPEQLVLGVGPEGGWTDAEEAAARSAGFRVISLGERILRVETASLLLTALAQFRFGDFGRPL